MTTTTQPDTGLRRIGGTTVSWLGHQTRMYELDRLREFVNLRADRPLRIIEVGSWVGESAIAMAQGLMHGGVVTCVDNWGGNLHDDLREIADQVSPDAVRMTFEENCRDYMRAGLINPITGNSLEVAQELPPHEADIIYLDAEHTYEAVKADIAAWLPHLKPGGLMMGHDYILAFPGLIQAVNETFGMDNIQILLHTPIWVVQL